MITIGSDTHDSKGLYNQDQLHHRPFDDGQLRDFDRDTEDRIRSTVEAHACASYHEGFEAGEKEERERYDEELRADLVEMLGEMSCQLRDGNLSAAIDQVKGFVDNLCFDTAKEVSELSAALETHEALAEKVS